MKLALIQMRLEQQVNNDTQQVTQMNSYVRANLHCINADRQRFRRTLWYRLVLDFVESTLPSSMPNKLEFSIL